MKGYPRSFIDQNPSKTHRRNERVVRMFAAQTFISERQIQASAARNGKVKLHQIIVPVDLWGFEPWRALASNGSSFIWSLSRDSFLWWLNFGFGKECVICVSTVGDRSVLFYDSDVFHGKERSEINELSLIINIIVIITIVIFITSTISPSSPSQP